MSTSVYYSVYSALKTLNSKVSQSVSLVGQLKTNSEMQQKAIRIRILNYNVQGAQAAEKYCRGWQRQAAVGEVGRKEFCILLSDRICKYLERPGNLNFDRDAQGHPRRGLGQP